MNKINLDIKSPWALLTTLIMGAALMTILAFADHDDDNYERQKANIDMANDGIVGYTHDGLPVLQSDLDNAQEDVKIAQAELQVDRALNIQIKGIKKVSEKILNENSLELSIDDKIYTILVGCKLTSIDTFQWQTRGDGSLDVGDFALTYRDPFHNYGNPKLRESLTKADVEEILADWDLNQRVCYIVGIQLKVLEVPETIVDVRG